jgi:hypothetical protein
MKRVPPIFSITCFSFSPFYLMYTFFWDGMWLGRIYYACSETRMQQKVEKLKSGIVTLTILYSVLLSRIYFTEFLNVEILHSGHFNNFLIRALNFMFDGTFIIGKLLEINQKRKKRTVLADIWN